MHRLRQGAIVRFNVLPTLLSLCLWLGIVSSPHAAYAQFSGEISQPNAVGDQLAFLADFRQGRVPFFNVTNSASTAVCLELLAYEGDMEAAPKVSTVRLPAAGNTVIDPTSLLNGGVGVVFATPMGLPGAANDPKSDDACSAPGLVPIVPSAPLIGNSTLADPAVPAAFGENPFGRRAVLASGGEPNANEAVDGVAVTYQRFAPGVLAVPIKFAVTGSGNLGTNLIVLASFDDNLSEGKYRAEGRSITPKLTIYGARGDTVSDVFDRPSPEFAGVYSSTLQGFIGTDPAPVPQIPDTASGKIFVDPGPDYSNLIGLFVTVLASDGGAVGVATRLPGVPSVAPSPTPTKSVAPPTATPPPPVGCRNGVFDGPPEQCDDGNANAGDGCSPSCIVEPCYSCANFEEGPSVCGPNLDNKSGCADPSNATCQEKLCVLDGPGARCSFRFTNASVPGSTTVCDAASGFLCNPTTGACDRQACLDGIVSGTEACDNGRTDTGCATGCEVAQCYTCTRTPGSISICTPSTTANGGLCTDDQAQGGICDPSGTCVSAGRCGDGTVDKNPRRTEECDDGDENNDDGCSSECFVEQDTECWECPQTGGECKYIEGKPCTSAAVPEGGVCEVRDDGRLRCARK